MIDPFSAHRRWADDDLPPDSLAVAALEAPRCKCPSPILDGDECGYCGREIRAEGSLAREFRTAAYMRRLSLAAGAGLPRSTGFRGLADEVGPNPELPELDVALAARVAALTPATDDPLLGRLEPLPVAVAA
jgi:hypothetical protein